MELAPVTLFGKVVRLEPLEHRHAADLAVAGNDETIWKYMLYGNLDSQDAMEAWINKLLEAQHQGTDLPFAVIHLEGGRAIGATRYLDVRGAHRSVEIGGTWYTSRYQRTAVNTECKYLLLRHAFEDLGCIRVQFKTDLRNLRSQRAIERLGAVKEGILRKHMITPDGTVRDSVFYSIIDDEWPAIKTRLEKLLNGI